MLREAPMSHMLNRIILRYVLIVVLILAISAITWMSDEFNPVEAISAIVLVGLVPIVFIAVALMKRKRD